MELHLISIFRFIVCLLALVAGLFVMIKADESHLLRLMGGAGACALLYYNALIGNYLYLAVGSTVEALITTFGLALIVTIGVSLVALPIVLVLRKLFP